MKKEVVILLAEDDAGHASLIQRNLKQTGLANELLHFRDGQEILDFLFREGEKLQRQPGVAYLLLLDIRMPKVDGVEVLRRIKQGPELRKLPVIMLTTTDDPLEIERCYSLGCSTYIAKPVDYDDFTRAIQQLGLFLAVVQMPALNGAYREN
ncbi:MAG: response regulator [Anaerolineae bacterium]